MVSIWIYHENYLLYRWACIYQKWKKLQIKVFMVSLNWSPEGNSFVLVCDGWKKESNDLFTSWILFFLCTLGPSAETKCTVDIIG